MSVRCIASTSKYTLGVENLLRPLLGPCLLTITIPAGFQLLHAVYVVERFLENLVKRHCSFHIAFFEGKYLLVQPFSLALADTCSRKRWAMYSARTVEGASIAIFIGQKCDQASPHSPASFIPTRCADQHISRLGKRGIQGISPCNPYPLRYGAWWIIPIDEHLFWELGRWEISKGASTRNDLVVEHTPTKCCPHQSYWIQRFKGLHYDCWEFHNLQQNEASHDG